MFCLSLLSKTTACVNHVTTWPWSKFKQKNLFCRKFYYVLVLNGRALLCIETVWQLKRFSFAANARVKKSLIYTLSTGWCFIEIFITVFLKWYIHPRIHLSYLISFRIHTWKLLTLKKNNLKFWFVFSDLILIPRLYGNSLDSFVY